MRSLLTILFVTFIAAFASAQEKPEGLFINSKAADFRAKDQDGNTVNMRDLRKKGPVVVIFYRGYWCPFCNKELKRFQDSLELITAKGASLVAITAEGGEGVDSTIARTGVTFPVISDQDMKIAGNYQVAYKLDERTVRRYQTGGIDITAINNQKTAMLPVPAAYIINTEGTVTYRFFNIDYRRRVWVKDILDNL